jgi:Putative adhesin
MAAPLPMTPARRTTLLIGVPVLLALLALSVHAFVKGALLFLVDRNPVSRSVVLSAPVTGGQVRVTSNDGNLVFRTSPQTSQIQVRGQLNSTFVKPVFAHQDTASGLSFGPICRVPFGNCSASFTVTAPSGLPVNVSTQFGNLTTSHLRGPVTLTGNSGQLTASSLSGRILLNDQFGNISASRLTGTVRVVNNSGDIDISSLTGPIQLTDQFGNIHASGLSGSMRLTNNSGDIDVSGATGDAQLRDAFGNIDVTSLAAATVTAGNNSGDITLRFTTVPRSVTVNDSFGNVTLILPAGAVAYQVHTHNSFGSTQVTVPTNPTARDVIRVTNNSGDITIINGQAPAAPSSAAQPARPVNPAHPARH